MHWYCDFLMPDPNPEPGYIRGEAGPLTKFFRRLNLLKRLRWIEARLDYCTKAIREDNRLYSVMEPVPLGTRVKWLENRLDDLQKQLAEAQPKRKRK